MNNRDTEIIAFLFVLLSLIFGANCVQQSGLFGEYLGQSAPDNEVQPFCPEVFSTQGKYGYHLHSSLYFTADGNEVFFTNQKVPVSVGYDQDIMHMKQQNGKWGEPTVVSFSGKYSDQIFFLSPDGKRIYFTSTRPFDGDKALDSRNVWIAEKTESGWSEPRSITSPLDLVHNDGTIYVTAQLPGGFGKNDIYRLTYIDGHYSMPENIGAPVNTELDEYACCAIKDERFIIYYSFIQNDKHTRGLYLCPRNNGHGWKQPTQLRSIFDLQDDFRATLSPDEKYLFILNRGDGIYWIDTEAVENKLK